jgi:hypothetical protein
VLLGVYYGSYELEMGADGSRANGEAVATLTYYDRAGGSGTLTVEGRVVPAPPFPDDSGGPPIWNCSP